MPARVHALLVVRTDGDPWHLERTLEALAAQTRPVDAVTIVVWGGELDDEVAGLVAASGAEGVITAPRLASYATCVRLGAHRLADADAVWLLAQDTAPAPDALQRLAGALEVQPSAAVFAPKLVEATDPAHIVSLGVGMTHLGRTVDLIDGKLDQGQYDAREDALGADVRGLLVRREMWDVLGGIDPALAGADEGLDLGVRARLAGARVILVPAARVAVHGDGVAGLPAPGSSRGWVRRRIYAQRTAQLHRRLAYAPPAAVPLHWLSIPLLAVLRTVLHLARKLPSGVVAEWTASAVVWVRLGSIARSRRRIRSASRATGVRIPWSRLAPLRVTRTQLRQRLDDPDGAGDSPLVRGDLRFFTGGGAWTVLAALVVGLVVFIALLAWPTLGGGGLLPLQESVLALWRDAAYGRRAVGLDVVGPADPFAAVIAVLGTLTFWNPGQALVILWVLALPLAALGGWFAATRMTDRSGLRIAGAVLWALAPMFLVALMQGRPAAVIVHLLLPWFAYTASVARRSWASAGGASLLLAVIAACAPSLWPALIVLWIALLVFAGPGLARVAWLPVPGVVLFAPLVWERGLGEGDWWGLLADPGQVFLAAQNGADAAGRALLAAGLPTPDLAGWAGFAPDGVGAWAWVLCVPLGVVALAAVLTARWRIAAGALAVVISGLGTAFGAAQLSVQSAGAIEVALWPGPGLSLAWLGAVGAALIALDARGLRTLRPIAATLVVAAVALLAMPTLLAPARGETLLRNGPTSTLPAYVAATSDRGAGVGTIVLTPLPAGELQAMLVWGGSQTLGSQTTIVSTRRAPSAGDERLATLAADLVSPGAVDPSPDLAAEGIGFVVLRAGADPQASALALQATAAMDARASLEAVGETSRGMLWRVAAEVAPRAPVSADVTATARGVAVVQIAVALIAVLLAVPTSASRRAARAHPRVVGVHRSRRRRRRGAARRRIAADVARHDGLQQAEDLIHPEFAEEDEFSVAPVEVPAGAGAEVAATEGGAAGGGADGGGADVAEVDVPADPGADGDAVDAAGVGAGHPDPRPEPGARMDAAAAEDEPTEEGR